MNPGKSVNFSVIKQKIIKTDEVLRMYVETNNKLKSVQEICKAIKLKHDQTVLNLNRIELENERCTFNLNNVKLKCELLEKENEKLQDQKSMLEDKYNQQTVQSQLNIKELQDQLTMVHEIKTSENLSPKKKPRNTVNENDKKVKELVDKVKQLEESEINNKKEIMSLNVQNKKLSNDLIITEKKHSDAIKKLQIENRDMLGDLLEELNKFKSQVNQANLDLEVKKEWGTSLENLNKEKDLEINELHKKIFTLIAEENKLKIIEEENETLRQKLIDQKTDLVNAKGNNSTKDICLQTDELSKNHTRSIHTQTMESMKSFTQQKAISIENRKLKQTLFDRDTDIFKLKAKSKIKTNHCHTQTDESDCDFESVENILMEMRMPFPMLSPMSTSSENLNLDILLPVPEDINDSHSVLTDIPDIIVTPPTPIKEKNIETLIDFHKTSCIPSTNENIIPLEQLESIYSKTDSKNVSELKNKVAKNNFKKGPRRKKYHPSVPSDNFVKLRKSCLRRMLHKRYVFKKEMRRVRRLTKQDCILKALRTLKHSNINFTISNESNIPKWWNNYSNCDSFKYREIPPNINQEKANTIRKTSISTQQYEKTKYITEKLDCSSKNCNNGNSCMLLHNVGGMTELLGFFNVKNESITPSSSGMGSIIDNKHLSLKSLNPTSSNEMTPETLLETLADLVSQKLKEKKSFFKKRQKFVSDKSDSFYSETETEIERLFATPDDSILRRNKMLLKRAKQQNLKDSLFAPSLKDSINGRKYAGSDSEIIPSKVVHSFEENEGSETEINSFEMDAASCLGNKNVSKSNKLDNANQCMINTSLNYSVCSSESDKNMINTLSVDPSECPVLSKKGEKVGNDCNSKMSSASIHLPTLYEDMESCDSFQYSICPELISPLSSLVDKDSPGSKSNHSLLQPEEKLIKNASPSNVKCLIYSNFQNEPNLFIASQNDCDISVNASPLLTTCVNKDLCNEKVTSEQIGTFLNNLETNVSDSILSVQCLKSQRPVENTTKEFLKVLPYVESNGNSVSKLNADIPSCPQSPTDDYEKNVDIMGPKMIPLESLPVQCGISSGLVENITKDILIVPPDAENNRNSLSKLNADIPCCPLSPIGDYEENVDIVSPKIIPLSIPVQCELSSSLVENITKDMLNVPPDAESNRNSVSKLNTDIPCCPQSPISDYEENLDIVSPKMIPSESIPVQHGISSSLVENITKDILKVLPDAENNQNNLSELIEDIPSCPQSPVNDYEKSSDLKVPKIIPLQRLVEQYIPDLDQPSTQNVPTYNFSIQDERIIVKAEILSSNNGHNEQLERIILDRSLREENSLSHLSKKNEIENIASCPVSPIKKKLMSIKTNLPEKWDEHNVTGHECVKHTPRLALNTNQKNEWENIVLDCVDNKQFRATKCLKATTRSASPVVLRRSKRVCKRISYSELLAGNGYERCNTEEISERLTDNSKPEDISDNFQLGPTSAFEDKSANKSLNNGSDIISKISKPIKKKPGRPKKYPIVESKCEEMKARESLHPKISHCENHLENTDLCISPREKISKEQNKVLNKVSENENLIVGLGKEPIEENIKSDMLIDQTNTELKSDISSESISGIYEDNRTNNLCENTELLTDYTNCKEKFRNNTMFEEKQTSQETAIGKENMIKVLKSPDTVFLKQTSNMPSDEKGTNNFWGANKYHDDLVINKSNFKEMDDKSNDEEKKPDIRNVIISKSEKIDESSDMDNLKNDVLEISDMISEEKRKIGLFERTIPHHDPLITESTIRQIRVKNNVAKEKLASKSTSRKRKNISTLKSNIIKQFKMKRKMFQMDFETVKESKVCSLKTIPKTTRSSTIKSKRNVSSNSKLKMTRGSNVSESTNIDNNETSCDDKRIHIVQNILIPANSSYAVDLMEKKKDADSKLPPNCDIKLDVTQTASQCDVKLCNPPLSKKKITHSIDDNVSFKNKRIKCVESKDVTNENSDILSKILGEMNKDRPNTTLKPLVIPSAPKQINTSTIEDGEWRKGIIVIAESICNVAPEKEDFKLSAKFGNRSRKKRPSTKERILMSRLIKLSTEERIPDEIIVEFKRRTVENIAEIVLQRVCQDTTDKAEDKYYPAPLMTKTQRILLGLMVRLEKENVPNVLNTFLSKADTLLFEIGCGIRSMIPITRLYLAVCRFQADIDRMRNFCCDAFYYMGDLAIPLLFTVLTSWLEVLPKEPDLKYYPLAKVLVQIVHLKGCNKPGYNLLPLRCLLQQYHEYPKERWNCDELFEELFQQYLRNPVKSAALRLFCKNKDTQWIFKKVDQFLKPLVYKIPEENVNFKATVIVLIGKICGQCKPKNEFDKASLRDLQRWFNGLIEGEESNLIENSVIYSLKQLRRKERKRPEVCNGNRMKIINTNHMKKTNKNRIRNVNKGKKRKSKHQKFEKNECER